ncbi:Sorting nexin-33-like [Oopsacas minuta]|uniref:Sorting nexin-33-like n=1 Tax=Oopsacas minuta TaxID=111878 RepID=A0AAV7JTA7_9METZ|nr:Sorting nexin-33-like [Oopsacas minuta]
MSKGRVLYDFEGEENGGELRVNAGEEVKIIQHDVGDGWMEAELVNGIRGIVPISYIQMLETPSSVVFNSPPPPTAPPFATKQTQNNDPEWDDEWDDNPQFQGQQRNQSYDNGQGTPSYLDPNPAAGKDVSFEGSHSTELQKSKSLKKSYNRFSSFVRTGGEAYILGTTTTSKFAKSSKLFRIKQSKYGPAWEESLIPFTVSVTDPEKKSKFHGMKTFIAYAVTPSNTNLSVIRRYKHYDWLHERLIEKFTCLSIPPLPDKQLTGRFNDDFVEKRRDQLEVWTNRIARHPVLGTSDVFSHFMSVSEEDTINWKNGKRAAEKDEFVGPLFFLSIDHNIETMELMQADYEVECFGKFATNIEEDLQHLRDRLEDRKRKFEGPFRREFQKFAGNIQAVAKTFQKVDQPFSEPLTRALDHTAITLFDIGEDHVSQPPKDLVPFSENIKEYLSILSAFPDLVHIHKGAVAKVRESEKLKDESKIGASDVLDVTNRTITVSAALQSEILHFQRQRTIDFQGMMKEYLKQQIMFYQNIANKLQSTLDMYEFDEDTISPLSANV